MFFLFSLKKCYLYKLNFIIEIKYDYHITSPKNFSSLACTPFREDTRFPHIRVFNE